MAKGQGMSEIRQSFGSWCCRLLAGVVWLSLLAVPSWSNPPPNPGYWAGGRQSPVVVLNGEFWQAMEKFANSNCKVYGDRTEFYLEKIATTEKFVVKTNLTLIEQNEKIIQLLEDLKRQGQKESH
jgi:hypothetical protein